MTHRSPRPVFGQNALPGLAVRRQSDTADWVEANRDQVQALITGDTRALSKRWVAWVDDVAQSSGGVLIWLYYLKSVGLTIPRAAGGIVNGTVTHQETGDLPTSGKGYNLRELRNTASVADGVTVTGLPGTYAVGPVSGYVECWHERLSTGEDVIMFDTPNPIDGACAAIE